MADRFPRKPLAISTYNGMRLFSARALLSLGVVFVVTTIFFRGRLWTTTTLSAEPVIAKAGEVGQERPVLGFTATDGDAPKRKTRPVLHSALQYAYTDSNEDAQARKRLVYLHLGTHKTGTTSFQVAMLAHQAHLRAHGLEPFIEQDTTETRANAWAFAHVVLRPEAITTPRLLALRNNKTTTPQDRLDAIEQQKETMRRTFETSANRTIVISAESFDHLRTPTERKLLLSILSVSGPVEIRPIVFFRDDASWRRSWRVEIRRTHPQLAVLMDQQGPEFPLLQEWWYDKDGIREFWKGVGPLREFEYEKELERGGELGVLPTLFEVIGCPLPPAAQLIWANPTLRDPKLANLTAE